MKNGVEELNMSLSDDTKILAGKHVGFLSLGCKVNSYETQAMQQLFSSSGAEIVPFEETADIYVINTCTVTHVADKKSRQMLHKAKKKNPQALVVAVGCYAQEAGEALLEDKGVDLLVGNSQKSQVVSIVAAHLSGKIMSGLKDMSKEQEYEDLFITDISEKTRAYIKIQDGCNRFCSYCIIPYVRGRIRSRNPEDVICEVEGLVQKGYKEVVLTGIHLSSYGTEHGKDEEKEQPLADLIVRICQVNGLSRVRLSSLEPRIITEAFLDRLSGADQLCPHFHLSLQSGCDATLQRMNRKYTSDEYAACCSLLRDRYDNPAITTDVIVGFPGETEDEFHMTAQFLEQIAFAKMHIFKYSVRKGTRAETMPNQVSEHEKALRSDLLLALEYKLRKDYMKLMIGKKEEILTEDTELINGTVYRVGHSKRYIKYAVLAEKVPENVLYQGIVVDFLTDEVLLMK